MPLQTCQRLALSRPGLGPVRLQSGRLLGVGQGGVIVAELRVRGGPVREQFRALLGLRRALAALEARVYWSTASSKFFSLNASLPNSLASGRRNQFSILLVFCLCAQRGCTALWGCALLGLSTVSALQTCCGDSRRRIMM